MCIYAGTNKLTFKRYLHRKKLTPQNIIGQVWLVQIYCKVKRLCASLQPGEAGEDCPNRESSSWSCVLSESPEASRASWWASASAAQPRLPLELESAPPTLLSIPKTLRFPKGVYGFWCLLPFPRGLLVLPSPWGVPHRALHDLPQFALQLRQACVLFAYDLGLL